MLDFDWTSLEGRLATTLPEDYKWLVSTYGAGKFDDFMHVLQPTSPFPSIQLEYSWKRSTEVLELLSEGEDIPYPIDTLHPVATSDNGDTIYWVGSADTDPGAWTITANGARNRNWPKFEGGIVSFLVGVLSGDVRMDVFPKTFPSAHPQFARYVVRASRRRP
ncbi:SMI1/KNR4 family protein [Streptomyces sp. NBC_01190]|uniref:SMI1/KNR4 family protein n=1 Tax=Streptomyces sp. NBC_01190 TaxID=2903767 RepID=UPI00386D88D5|nr:SMI1/KNR4 family protein [Streptomyces sp. NBC_01190]